MNASEHGPHTTSDNEQPPVQPGRDARGRFAKGNVGGPGNPFARKAAALRTALIETVTEEDMRFIAEQLVVIARLGDLAAIKLLFQYVLGKPAAAVDPDTLDLHELDLYRRGPSAQEVHDVACQRLPADAVAEVLRVEMPCLGANFKDAAARGILGIGPDDDPEEEEEDEAAERKEVAAPLTNGGVADKPRRTMTGPSGSEGLDRRADAAPLLEKLSTPPIGNGGGGEHLALEWLRQRLRD
jgi:hypothetical protein